MTRVTHTLSTNFVIVKMMTQNLDFHKTQQAYFSAAFSQPSGSVMKFHNGLVSRLRTTSAIRPTAKMDVKYVISVCFSCRQRSLYCLQLVTSICLRSTPQLQNQDQAKNLQVIYLTVLGEIV